VVLKGSPKVIRGFLAGLALGSAQCLPYWFHHDEDITSPAAASAAKRAAALLHLQAGEVRLVATAPLVKLLRKVQKEAADRGICEVGEIARIKSASFRISYQAYAQRYHQEIQDLLHDLPRGVQLVDEDHEIRTDPSAVGVEAYAPAHDFEAAGSARLSGRFDLVLAKRKQMREHPLVAVEDLELVLD
jgi:hypothetical protein